jgi:hypothetical protein
MTWLSISESYSLVIPSLTMDGSNLMDQDVSNRQVSNTHVYIYLYIFICIYVKFIIHMYIYEILYTDAYIKLPLMILSNITFPQYFFSHFRRCLQTPGNEHDC